MPGCSRTTIKTVFSRTGELVNNGYEQTGMEGISMEVQVGLQNYIRSLKIIYTNIGDFQLQIAMI